MIVGFVALVAVAAPAVVIVAPAVAVVAVVAPAVVVVAPAVVIVAPIVVIVAPAVVIVVVVVVPEFEGHEAPGACMLLRFVQEVSGRAHCPRRCPGCF